MEGHGERDSGGSVKRRRGQCENGRLKEEDPTRWRAMASETAMELGVVLREWRAMARTWDGSGQLEACEALVERWQDGLKVGEGGEEVLGPLQRLEGLLHDGHSNSNGERGKKWRRGG
uniref:Uncharacterized protein n=1 Tax=Oryza nivara TaxID=4536 RepID=A0A0E0IPI0_ORYNI